MVLLKLHAWMILFSEASGANNVATDLSEEIELLGISFSIISFLDLFSDISLFSLSKTPFNFSTSSIFPLDLALSKILSRIFGRFSRIFCVPENILMERLVIRV